MSTKFAFAKYGLAAFVSLASTSASAVPMDVDLMLSLMVDVSGSVNTNDFNTQRDGYVNAFKDPAVQAKIDGGDVGAVAVNLVYWSTSAAEVIPFTLIDDGSNGITASMFGDLIAAESRPANIGSATGMAVAMGFGDATIQAAVGDADDQFNPSHIGIDISGDGSDNIDCPDFGGTGNAGLLDCGPVQDARDGFLTGIGDFINALWIEASIPNGDIADDFCVPGNGVGGGDCTIDPVEYGNLNVIGGTLADGGSAFQIVVSGFGSDDFEEAVLAKLLQEGPPNGMPVPASIWLVSLGLGALGWRRRRV